MHPLEFLLDFSVDVCVCVCVWCVKKRGIHDQTTHGCDVLTFSVSVRNSTVFRFQ